MAENFDLIFGSSASQSYSWNDSDYQNGWQTVGDTPPTREQFDALQRRADLKTQELNNRLAPIEENDTHDYRQPSTAYTAGQIAYHATLPTGWYLECTTAGDTDAGALVITSPSVGGTVTDGTVVWTVREGASTKGLSIFTNGVASTDFSSAVCAIRLDSNNRYLQLIGGDNSSTAPYLRLFGSNYSDDNVGSFTIRTNDGTNAINFVGRPDGQLRWNSNDLAGSAIVAKSLGTNGYIKYASGLIIQWGLFTSTGTIDNSDSNGFISFVTTPGESLGQFQLTLRQKAIAQQNISVDAVWVNDNRFRVNAQPALPAGSKIAWLCISK